MIEYCERVWKLRYFWGSLVRLDLRTRYRRSMLGLGWALLQPLAMATIISVVFSNLWGMSIREFPSILCGVCVWQFICNSNVAGCHCFLTNEVYIRQFPAPLAIYPLRVALVTTFHMTVAMTLVLAFTLAFRGFPGVVGLLSAIPSLLLLSIMGWSIAALMGLVNVRFPDSQHLSEVLLQMMFYATPIIYPADVLRSRGVGWVIDCNPLAAVMAIVRDPILHGTYPPLQTMAVGMAFVCGLALLAMLLIGRSQDRLVYQL